MHGKGGSPTKYVSDLASSLKDEGYLVANLEMPWSGYYREFGFTNMPGLVLEGVPQEAFFALSIDGQPPQGSVAFHEGFKADKF
jgi:predicted N-acetyltransferase YhbS